MEQIAIFCDTDYFCRAYEEYCRNKLLMDKEEVVPRTRMSLSEIMTILIMYHLSGPRKTRHPASVPFCSGVCSDDSQLLLQHHNRTVRLRYTNFEIRPYFSW